MKVVDQPKERILLIENECMQGLIL